jgi:CheY-like chemotaxis protein
MTSDPNRKTVLFVDDDAPFLEVLQPYMQRLSRGGWEVLAVTDSAAALATLDSRTVDLAVLDVRMPVMDGRQLLQLLNRKHPQLKKAVLSGFVDDECRSLAFTGGAELVLEKPRDLAGYEALYAALNEIARLPVEQGFRGVLQRAGLADIIQMECLSRRSLILEVSAAGRRGRIYIRSGTLVHAECGDMTGEPALQQLLTMSSGEFRHLPFAEPARETLEGSWEFLLLEAVRQRDEAAGEALATTATEEIPTIQAAPIQVVAEPEESTDTAPIINELVVCSDTGEMLYGTGSENPTARCQLCMTLAQGAAQLEALLPLGSLERVEFLSAPGRVVARFQDSQAIFLRADDV